MKESIAVFTKSKVPVGSAEKLRVAVSDALELREVDFGIDVDTNPEFLKEVAAMKTKVIIDGPKLYRITIVAEASIDYHGKGINEKLDIA